jgi:hypothetical protein
MKKTGQPSSLEEPETDDVWLAPADAFDPVIEAYKRDVDRSLLRENLKLTPAERAQKLVAFARFAAELQEAGRRARVADPSWGLK